MKRTIYFYLIEITSFWLLFVQCQQSIEESNCNMYRSISESEYKCTNEGLQIATYDQTGILKFICNGTTSNQLNDIAKNYSILHGKSFHMKVAWFINCPLPNVPLVEIASPTPQEQEINTIRFQDFNIGDNFDPIHFKGFNGRQLILINNNLTILVDDLFGNDSNVETLTMFSNQVNLSTKAFSKLKKLLNLDLGDNQIEMIDEYAFENFSSLTMLNLWGNKIKSIHPKAFKDLINLERLELLNNHLETLPVQIFSSTLSLKKIGLKKNHLERLPSNLFKNSTNLEEIYLSYNNLKTLPEKFLANLHKLKKVILDNNQLTYLPNDLFMNSKSVEVIDLHMNNISMLSIKIFESLTKLIQLNISFNKIHRLPEIIFHSHSKITHLDLSYNKIEYLDKDVFKYQNQLKVLNLGNNELTIIDNIFEPLIELQELNLQQNKIMLTKSFASPLHANIKLRNLDLSYNHINQIFQDWNLLVKLQNFDLSYNEIEVVEARDLYFTSPESVLNLSHNKIRMIDMRYSSVIGYHNLNKTNPKYPPTRQVNLNFNPLDCNCHIYYLLKDIQGSNFTDLVNLEVDNLKCADPDLNGTSIYQISYKKIACEIDPCPTPCNCRYRLFDQKLIINCVNQNLTSPPLFNSTLQYVRSTIDRSPIVELELAGNFLNNFPTLNDLFGSKMINLTRMELSRNNISFINSEDILPSLQILNLDHNKIAKLDDDTIKVLSNYSNLKQLKLNNNPIECNCKIKNMLQFVQTNYRKMGNMSSPSCAMTGGPLDNRTLISITIQELCSSEYDFLIAALITVACFGVLLAIVISFYFRFQEEIKLWIFDHGWCLWFFPKDYDLNKEKTYDAFISFSHKDDNFVIDKLIPGLENCERPFKLCVHYRDWVPGEYIPTQIANSVQNSRRTIIVLSKHFIESDWSKMEFRTAHKQTLTENRRRVIVILYGDIGPLDRLDNELRTYLSINTYVKWGDPWFWEKLRYALPRRENVKNNNKSENYLRNYRLKSCSSDKDLVKMANNLAATTPPATNVLNPLDVITSQVQANKLLVAEQGLHVKAV